MFKGVFSAIITPFKNGKIDYEGLEKLIEYQISGGVNGIVPCGTTGESATLSHQEHKDVIHFTVEKVRGRVVVLAGTGSNATDEALELTQYAKSAGADGALLITPYYNKPTQEGLYRHFLTIADSVAFPQVPYNVPGRTAVDMVPETISRLAAHDNIVAIKEATADLERASVIFDLCGDRISLLSGDDATFFPFLVVGGQGAISVTANFAPARVASLWKAWQKGNISKAQKEHRALLKLNRLLFCETSPIPAKAVGAMLNLCSEDLRLPLVPLSEKWRKPLRKALKALDLPVS
ncbi:4-hydroxy-tetrahydrodipicolinate synthase [Magnetococcales bacterium HHB-1]